MSKDSHYKYKLITTEKAGGGNATKLLNEYIQDDWEYVETVHTSTWGNYRFAATFMIRKLNPAP